MSEVATANYQWLPDHDGCLIEELGQRWPKLPEALLRACFASQTATDFFDPLDRVKVSMLPHRPGSRDPLALRIPYCLGMVGDEREPRDYQLWLRLASSLQGLPDLLCDEQFVQLFLPSTSLQGGPRSRYPELWRLVNALDGNCPFGLHWALPGHDTQPLSVFVKRLEDLWPSRRMARILNDRPPVLRLLSDRAAEVYRSAEDPVAFARLYGPSGAIEEEAATFILGAS